MKITVNTTNAVTFKELERGTTFICPEYDEDVIFMVVEPDMDVVIKPDEDWCEEDEFAGYAIGLNMGTLSGFDADEKVIRVDTELIVNK